MGGVCVRVLVTLVVAAAVSYGAGGGGPSSRDRGASAPGWAIPLGGKPRSEVAARS